VCGTIKKINSSFHRSKFNSVATYIFNVKCDVAVALICEKGIPNEEKIED
jgi:hypothetical protein